MRPRADPKSLNRSTQNLKQVITSARRPPVQNFVQIRALGASRQMGENSKNHKKVISFNSTLAVRRCDGE